MACCCVSFLSRIFDFDFLAFDHGQSVPAAKAVRYGEIDSRQFMHFVIDLAWLTALMVFRPKWNKSQPSG